MFKRFRRKETKLTSEDFRIPNDDTRRMWAADTAVAGLLAPIKDRGEIYSQAVHAAETQIGDLFRFAAEFFAVHQSAAPSERTRALLDKLQVLSAHYQTDPGSYHHDKTHVNNVEFVEVAKSVLNDLRLEVMRYSPTHHVPNALGYSHMALRVAVQHAERLSNIRNTPQPATLEAA